MSILDTTIQEIFGSRKARIVYVIIAAVIATFSFQKYVVTVPVFAQAMKQMQQQMWTGDRIQEKQWLQSEIDRLKNQLWHLHAKGANMTDLDRQMVTSINEQIYSHQKRIDQINYDMQNRWSE